MPMATVLVVDDNNVCAKPMYIVAVGWLEVVLIVELEVMVELVV